MTKTLRIGTRKSVLALVQTELVANALKRAWPDIEIEILTRDTLGDRILDKPLQEFGGKGVFVSEFEQAILDGVIDLAVHSAKDLPMELAAGLELVAVSEREDPRDVLVTLKAEEQPGMFNEGISGGAQRFPGRQEIRIGTSSPRRQLLVKNLAAAEGLWPDTVPVRCETLRGNVHTRLKNWRRGCTTVLFWQLQDLNVWEYSTLPARNVPLTSIFLIRNILFRQEGRGSWL